MLAPWTHMYGGPATAYKEAVWPHVRGGREIRWLSAQSCCGPRCSRTGGRQSHTACHRSKQAHPLQRCLPSQLGNQRHRPVQSTHSQQTPFRPLSGSKQAHQWRKVLLRMLAARLPHRLKSTHLQREPNLRGSPMSSIQLAADRHDRQMALPTIPQTHPHCRPGDAPDTKCLLAAYRALQRTRHRRIACTRCKRRPGGVCTPSRDR